MPAHLALLNIPAHGHVNPTLELTAELVARGHRVTYATTEEFAPAVARTGADVLLHSSTLTSRPRTEAPPSEFAAWLPVVLLNESATTLPVFERHFARDVPDLLLYDRTLYLTGRVLGERWRRPAVELFPSFAYNEHFSLARTARTLEPAGSEPAAPEHPARALFRGGLAELTRAHGTGPITPEEFELGREEFAVAFLPREFQVAGETFPDDRFAFVGPCLGDQGRQDDRGRQDDWQSPTGSDPLLFVSLGTAFGAGAEFFRTCVRAFADQPWRVVLATGAVDPAALGDLPPNIVAHSWVPQLAVLERASVFLTHCGMGSAMEALHHDTPMVAFPLSVEQAAIADRVAELGLGAVLPAHGLTPARLRAGVTAVASDPAVRERVRAMGAHTRAAGGARRAADAVERRLARAGLPCGPPREAS
ncbi:hypothetical protein OG455_09805 [Kitasatospora sp. NBC_01287]|uniref:macrolide family glycosyltransferase n=1 Tax=Kitasatospora sp. NBC_01287 TaxID=2903573 RepID=UPI00225B1316|nr:macrolide family glycosyltransferase [Kitasatospora sp. NBC_01287]MCX4745814.1 hypothetical protein [Kitasatospora sp. NBC_01287]